MDLKNKIILLKKKINENKEKLISFDIAHSKNVFTESVQSKVEKIRSNTSLGIIQFNVRGVIFSLSRQTILNNKDTLFYYLINDSRYDGKEIYFDRSPYCFKLILHFLRFKTFDYSSLHNEEIALLLDDASYYEVDEITNYLSERLKGCLVISYEYTIPYMIDDIQYTPICNIDDFSNKSLKTGGICVDKGGSVTFTLNADWPISSMEIGPYILMASDSGWMNSFGAGAQILVSHDKNIWSEVGKIPQTYSSKILKIEVLTSARFIKIQSQDSPLGISYFKVSANYKK